MTTPSRGLRTASALDFSKTALDYEGFRQLAINPNLTANEKMGFGPGHRSGFESLILEDVCNKLPTLAETAKTVVDIGCGIGPLTERIVGLCIQNQHRLIMVDSEEMLAQAPSGPGVIKVPGMFPKNASDVSGRCENGADVIVCYSVLHYIFVDTNVFRFSDSIIELLKSGGFALIGDIPNESKSRRFFSSPKGVEFHRKNMRTNEMPMVRNFCVERDRIDDSVLAAIVARAQAAGCHAYILPQDRRLPMATRRDDLLIVKP